ncbi:MAG: glycosyltransferase family 2 protein [Planctomycetes bacterium]|nr:glycosyltransferase family 2 protein [Planctomycetota bacterium]MCB9887108.1 glycosyltransferase family 2 protein [Planctomycetota bacterium]
MVTPGSLPHADHAEGHTAPGGAPEISVVVPIYNERDNIAPLHAALTYALAALHRSYEILFVDDGSTDGTADVMRACAATDPHLRLVFFRRNYGQTPAMAAGFRACRGRIVVSMDGDLQNDPADIPRLVARLDDGFDVVCGWRRHRQDRMATRLLPSRIANFLIARVTGARIHDTGCSLKAYRGWVVRSLHLYSDMHRFLAALGAGIGARITEVPVRHHARRAGQSKYGLGRIFRVLADLVGIKMLIQFAAHPIRWFTLLSLPLFVLAPLMFALGFVKVTREGQWLLFGDYDMAAVAAGSVALLFAMNVFLLGFLAELQIKVSKFFRQRISITAREASR